MVIAGGYGTGRELVEFFLNHGVLGGILAMWLVSTVIWSAVCALTFELSRQTKTYEYRTFCKTLLGRGWPVYEICYLVTMVIILSVIAAAAGSIVEQIFSLPYYVGVGVMTAAVGFLVLKGTSLVEKFLSIWSFVLYGVFIVFLIACFATFGDDIVLGLRNGEAKPGWFLGGIEYAAYNVGFVPAILFVVRHLERRKEAFTAGLLAGPIAMFPAFFFLLAMAGRYPQILPETVPSIFLLSTVGSTLLLYLYQIMLLGTLVETGTALIHAFNERIATALEEKGHHVHATYRPIVAVGLLLGAAVLAQVGLSDLIARGYGTVTYGFWLVYLLPVLTWGAYKVFAVP